MNGIASVLLLGSGRGGLLRIFLVAPQRVGDSVAAALRSRGHLCVDGSLPTRWVDVPDGIELVVLHDTPALGGGRTLMADRGASSGPPLLVLGEGFSAVEAAALIEGGAEFVDWPGEAELLAARAAATAARSRRADPTPVAQGLSESNHLLAIKVDRAGRLTWMNDVVLRTTGWRREELIGRVGIEVITDAPERELRGAQLRAAYTEGEVQRASPQVWLPTRSGERRLVRWISWLERDGAGEPSGLTAVGEDVTGSHRHHLLELQQQVTVAVNAALDVPTALGSALSLVCQVAGWGRGRTWLPVNGSEPLTPGQSFHRAGLEAPTADAPDLELATRAWRTGTHVWGAVSGPGSVLAIPVHGGGRVVAVIELSAPDPTHGGMEREAAATAVAAQLGILVQARLAEVHARQREQQLDLALRASHMCAWSWDSREGVFHWSSSTHDVIGWPPAALPTPAAYLSHVDPEWRPRLQAEIDRLLIGPGSLATEYPVVQPDGSLRWVASWSEKVSGGEVVQLVGTIQDVTERRCAQETLRTSQERLAQADRLAAVGTLAASVAHELNNPRTWVGANLTLLARELPAASAGARPEARARLLESLDLAAQGVERVRAIVGDLRVFAGGRAEERAVPVDLHRVLDMAARMAQNEMAHRARLVRRDGPVPRVLASEARLGQVFLNLLVNAAQAIPEGEADRHEIRLITRTDARGWAEIEVSDTGAGMPPEVL